MKLAFTSCMSAYHFPSQPVWDSIAQAAPGHLLLLGDSVYNDVPIALGVHPRELDPNDYLVHLHGRWRKQLAVPQFRALCQAVPTHAIWDDHDFLWNESYGEGAIQRPALREHIRTSRALFNAFVRALERQLAPGSFPAQTNAWELNQPDEPPPGYRAVELVPGVWLHLTDGRSWRIKKTLLGAAQRHKIEQAMKDAPDAVHLLASGSKALFASGERWGQFDDYVWLENLAQQHKLLVLSGDIHRNEFDSLDLGLGRWLHEATASGAAMKSHVVEGAERRNHGLLEISSEHIDVRLFSFGQAEAGKAHRIKRSTWRAAPL